VEFIDLKSQQARIRQDLERRIGAVLDHGRYILGPEVAELEDRLAGFVEVDHCLTISSGTDALLVALMALEIGPGDEVITVPYTWISTAEMIALLGATPVFVDIDEETWNLDPKLLERAITARTKAIMPVGIFGQPPDLTRINEVAAEHGGLPVIEDAAQSFGATHRGRRSGGLTTIGATSFFPSKPLGCYGDGGAVFTRDGELAERMRWIRVHGQKQKHEHPVLGVNGRFDTLQAAVLLAKLGLFEEEIRLRQDVAVRYGRELEDVAGVKTPQVTSENTSVFAQYTILSRHRDAIRDALRACEIPSVSYYVGPLHLQGVFASLGGREGDFPVSERVSRECLSLPMSPYLSHDDIGRVATVVRQVCSELS